MPIGCMYFIHIHIHKIEYIVNSIDCVIQDLWFIPLLHTKNSISLLILEHFGVLTFANVLSVQCIHLILCLSFPFYSTCQNTMFWETVSTCLDFLLHFHWKTHLVLKFHHSSSIFMTFKRTERLFFSLFLYNKYILTWSPFLQFQFLSIFCCYVFPRFSIICNKIFFIQ